MIQVENLGFKGKHHSNINSLVGFKKKMIIAYQLQRYYPGGICACMENRGELDRVSFLMG